MKKKRSYELLQFPCFAVDEIIWCHPEVGKVNFDGSCVRSSKVMGGGGAIRDHAGQYLSGFSANFGVESPIIAELLPMVQGLTLTWNMGFKKVIMKSDCLEEVQLISDGVQIRLHQIMRVTSNVRVWLSRD
ncbi:hypothetical protein Lal_00037347 [Lupinus albus]|nr:hypothetical protein Lal_00037347 [Lupinus albus]